MNQSLLKQLIKGPRAFTAAQAIPEKELYYEEKAHFMIGQAIDCYITQGEEEFSKIYYKADSNCKPKSDKIKSIIKQAFDRFALYVIEEDLITGIPSKETVADLLTIDTWNQYVWEACESDQFYMNRSKPSWQYTNDKGQLVEDGRLKTVRDDKMVDYVHDLFKSLGKQILSEDESVLVGAIIMSLTTHPNTCEYINPTNLEDDDIDIYFQLPIFFDYSNHEVLVGQTNYRIGYENPEEAPEEIVNSCKLLLDMLIVNNTRQTIQPIDIKTTMYEPYNFLFVVKDRRYDIQGVHYTYGINKEIQTRKKEVSSDELAWKGYTQLPFKFIVESNQLQFVGNPLIFTMGESMYTTGFYGRPGGNTFIQTMNKLHDNTDMANYYGEIKGVKQLFEDYNYYIVNSFTKRREIAECGEFIMEWSKSNPVIKNQ